MKNRLKSCPLALVGIALLTLMNCGGISSQSPPPQPSPSGQEVVYGIATSSLLNYFIAYTIDSDTGAFVSFLPTTPPPIGCSGGIVAVDAQFLYISIPPGCTADGAGEILGYSLDQTTGAPTALAGSPFSLASGVFPQGLATLANSHLLYVADSPGTGGGRIDAFTVDSVTGVPTAIPGSPFASGTNAQLVVDPSGKFLYASDDDPPGGVLAFTISSTGALTPVPGSPFTIPSQTVADSQPFGIVDTGQFVYTVLTASNQIAAFSINSVTGALTPLPGSPFSTGNSPNGALVLANNLLYTITGQGASISGYSINSDSGALTLVPGSPFSATGSSTLTADPSGKYLYVSTFDSEQGYSIDASTGAITLCEGPVEGIDGTLWLTVVQWPS